MACDKWGEQGLTSGVTQSSCILKAAVMSNAFQLIYSCRSTEKFSGWVRFVLHIVTQRRDRFLSVAFFGTNKRKQNINTKPAGSYRIPFPGELLIDQNSLLSYKLFHEDFLDSAGLKCFRPWAARAPSILAVNSNKLKLLSTCYLTGRVLSTSSPLIIPTRPVLLLLCPFCKWENGQSDHLARPTSVARGKYKTETLQSPGVWTCGVHTLWELHHKALTLSLLDTPSEEPAVFYPFIGEGASFQTPVQVLCQHFWQWAMVSAVYILWCQFKGTKLNSCYLP